MVKLWNSVTSIPTNGGPPKQLLSLNSLKTLTVYAHLPTASSCHCLLLNYLTTLCLFLPPVFLLTPRIHIQRSIGILTSHCSQWKPTQRGRRTTTHPRNILATAATRRGTTTETRITPATTATGTIPAPNKDNNHAIKLLSGRYIHSSQPNLVNSLLRRVISSELSIGHLKVGRGVGWKAD